MPSLLHLYSLPKRDSKNPDVADDGDSQKAVAVDDEQDYSINAGELTFEEGTLMKPLTGCGSCI